MILNFEDRLDTAKLDDVSAVVQVSIKNHVTGEDFNAIIEYWEKIQAIVKKYGKVRKEND